MTASFYSKLALDGIRKNKRLYIPYIVIGSVMVMMFYILSFLSEAPALDDIRGGSAMMELLPLITGIIGVFSLLFLFYTNSFLIRQRYREFGLYNVLGMDKRNIGRIMIWESIFVGIAAIISGIVIGVALSKAAELVFLNLIQMNVSFELGISVKALGQTALIYGVIYLLLLCSSLIKVKRSKPLELMQSSKVGERIPKINWLLAVIGVIFIGTAYYLAVTIEQPLTAFSVFFIAVILVIVSTYLLFISGSVVFCKLLQKNKRYYYKPNHFVSVSSMIYRMKRNGAGLASICILLTMVLVMISATASLYFGKENSLQTRYPHGVNITAIFDDTGGISDENIEKLRKEIISLTGKEIELNGLRTGEVPGLFTDKGINIDFSAQIDFSLSTYDNVGYLTVVSLDDYNRMSGNNETLADDECMLYCISTEYTSDTFAMADGKPYKVKKVLDEFIADAEFNSIAVPTICIVMDDFDAFVEPVLPLKNSYGGPMMLFDWRCGFDAGTPEEEIAAANTIEEFFSKAHANSEYRLLGYSVQSRESSREDFYLDFGSLFFIGIMLSIVFLLAAVLIIYYKQISEGFEDRFRFEIMQNVGMTKKDIRSSINSQILTVFFLPVVCAGIHLAFAFPFFWKILMLFGLNNMPLVIGVTLTCFMIFGLFYAVVYKITSGSYYSIVSARKN